MSDVGPWTEPQFAKPPKWAQKADNVAAAPAAAPLAAAPQASQPEITLQQMQQQDEIKPAPAQ